MKYCVYEDGTTTQQENGTVCGPNKGIAQLVDEFEIPDTSVEVHSNMFWVDIAVVALFFLPKLLSKKK